MTPPPPPAPAPPGGVGNDDPILEGDEATEAIAEAGRRSTARRELASHDGFDELSPEVGVLDEEAFDRLADEDLDAALTLLAELTGATDAALRAAAVRLAARVSVDLVRHHAPAPRGVGMLDAAPASRFDGDVDLDRSMDPIVEHALAGRRPSVEELTVTSWRQPRTAVCLVVDRSGSMHGERLAAAALAAAAVAFRELGDTALIAFGSEAVVVSPMGTRRPVADVCDDLFRLRGHGTTDVALALRAATRQLDRTGATRKVTVLLSDCRTTSGDPPTVDAARCEELVIIAPADDLEDAEALAREAGGRVVPLAGPSGVPAAVGTALSRGDRR